MIKIDRERFIVRVDVQPVRSAHGAVRVDAGTPVEDWDAVAVIRCPVPEGVVACPAIDVEVGSVDVVDGEAPRDALHIGGVGYVGRVRLTGVGLGFAAADLLDAGDRQ